jgi:hypothetical protein
MIMGDLEKELLLAMIVAHLDSGLTIGLKGREWFFVHETEEKGHYSSLLGEDAREWGDPHAAAEDIIAQLRLKNLSYDAVTFYDEEKTGVTWRFLKLDMPFLRIVLGKDKRALGGITRRLSAILRENLEEGRGDSSLN